MLSRCCWYGRPPSVKIWQKYNYKQLHCQVIDTIKGMLNERFQDRKSFEFLDLLNPKVFRTWEGKVPSNKTDLLKQKYGPLFAWHTCLKASFMFYIGTKISIKKIAWNYWNTSFSLICNLVFLKLSNCWKWMAFLLCLVLQLKGLFLAWRG